MPSVLLMCEGRSETHVVSILLYRNLLRWKNSDLLSREPMTARQLDEAIEGAILGAKRGEPVEVFRIGDKLSDAFRKSRNPAVNRRLVYPAAKVLTKPELEVLFLIWEGRYSDYLSWKKGRHPSGPSDYYKTLHPEYHKDAVYLHDYFAKMGNAEIVAMLKAYKEKRYGAHAKDELCLYDLLREDIKK